MQLAFITPTSYLHRFATQGDFYLALAHLVDDEGKNEYARFHKKEALNGKKVILDNGLFEGAQVTPEQLIKRARSIRAHTVCAPDALYDSRGTIKEFKKFIKLKQEEGLVADVMGIPQANNPQDWWSCFEFFQLNEDCNLIGLSILSVTESFKHKATHANKWPITASRVHLLKQLYSFQEGLGHEVKKCHMLGLGESYADISTAIRLLPKSIISNDSSSAFVHGAQGIVYRDNGIVPGGKDHTKLNFNLPYGTLKDEHIDAVQKNIDTAKRIRRIRW